MQPLMDVGAVDWRVLQNVSLTQAYVNVLDRPGAGVPPDTDRSFGRPAANISPIPTGGPPAGADGALVGGRGALAYDEGPGPPAETPLLPDVLPDTAGPERSFVCTSLKCKNTIKRTF